MGGKLKKWGLDSWIRNDPNGRILHNFLSFWFKSLSHRSFYFISGFVPMPIPIKSFGSSGPKKFQEKTILIWVTWVALADCAWSKFIHLTYASIFLYIYTMRLTLGILNVRIGLVALFDPHKTRRFRGAITVFAFCQSNSEFVGFSMQSERKA